MPPSRRTSVDLRARNMNTIVWSWWSPGLQAFGNVVCLVCEVQDDLSDSRRLHGKGRDLCASAAGELVGSEGRVFSSYNRACDTGQQG